MEPQVEYARTEDGVSIACWAVGDGPPLVWLPPMPGHVGLEWSAPVLGRQYQALAARYRLIRYDGRDMGLSGRTGQIWKPDAFERDLKAVSDHLDAARFALMAEGPSGLGAMPYAARHPERVTHLVLNECFASFSDMTAESSAVRAMASLIRDDYRVYTETIALQFFGWEQHDAAREYAELMRRSQTHEEALAYMGAFMTLDVSAELERIAVPTMITHHRDASLVPMSVAQSLASRIPGARLVVLEGDTVAGPRDQAGEAAALDQFVLGADTPGAPPAPTIPSGTAVILFADIADSTQLTEELGDTAFRAQARDLDALLRRIIGEEHGATIEGKLVGDGVMAAFASARQAIAAAVRCDEATNSTQLRLHIGLHAGDVIHEGSNVYGGAVNVAARVAQEAAPGEVLVSDVVRTLARTSAGVRFEDRGERELKGVSDVQRLWAVVAEQT